MENYNKLVEHYKTIANYNHLSAICGWDAAAMMPSGGNQARSEAMAQLSLHIHQLSTAPHLSDLINQAQDENLSAPEHASLREMKRQWQLSTVVPEDLVKAKSLAGSKCEHAWRTQRGANDWSGFCNNFEEVVNLSQQEAQIRGEVAGLTPYDAMLDIYEPGVNSEQLNSIFGDLTSWLPELTQQVQDKQKQESVHTSNESYSTSAQNALGLEVMSLLNFDFEHGRLDISSHPFCGGVPEDVRITTRYDEQDFVQSLMGIVHETGHARYEQGLPRQWAGLPAGQARSMGIHESQSLFFEMQLGRSDPFIANLAPLARQHFKGNDPSVFEANNLKKIYTRVQPGYIRVDADELTYPAHVILRYEIERDLMNGKISYKDIPELWDNKMQQYLGLSTKDNYKDGCMQDIHWTDAQRNQSHNYKNGCMQDIHWCDGSFGYFPSYTLGAMYAAQQMATIKKLMNVDEIIQSGDLTPIFDWLDTNIWKKASLFTTDDLMTQATGEALNPLHFRKHLEERYLK
ncbi:carboxypeptidase M32 [Vibrio sp. ZSDZ65]|uniref:Metal-dependent carboxypeptidase n=1 Tax=Vibrio qingdaonensis TaxID=2829491 RepID=A0A9X3CSA6_9VIBR|nr:carboxypeptidase M32 [Vibrio qingdaonensis]MCW8348505.1 carboxypeptidase M32 [Vibrio qingdaonensis]